MICPPTASGARLTFPVSRGSATRDRRARDFTSIKRSEGTKGSRIASGTACMLARWLTRSRACVSHTQEIEGTGVSMFLFSFAFTPASLVSPSLPLSHRLDRQADETRGRESFLREFQLPTGKQCSTANQIPEKSAPLSSRFLDSPSRCLHPRTIILPPSSLFCRPPATVSLILVTSLPCWH